MFIFSSFYISDRNIKLNEIMDSFKVNDFITLKLEEENTNIYIKNQLFSQCKFLLLEIPVDTIQPLENINSIDEAAEKLDNSFEPMHENIKKRFPPEVEFWGHCSNIQVWAEHNYDTCLLHSNLAFPLLKWLAREGDLMARKVFKEEVVRRIESGFPSVVKYLVLEGYLDYLNDEEVDYVISSPELISGLVNSWYKDEDDHYQFEGLYYLLNKLKDANNYCFKEMIRTLLRRDDFRVAYFLDRTNLICGISKKERAYLLLEKNEAEAILKMWDVMDISIDELDFSINPRHQGARIFVKDKHVTELDLSYLGLENIHPNIFKLGRLEYLGLSGNKILEIPKSINKMKFLSHLVLNENNISKIPIELCKLKNLKILNLSKNKITRIPQCIDKLESLERFIIRNNNLTSIPETILKLRKLKEFDCRQREIINISTSIKNEKNIKIKY
jgi:hypothetical protein